MTAIILAGGKSSRFGSDKAFIEIEGQPLINRQVKLLKRLFKKIIIVTNNAKKYRFRTVKIIPDIIPGQGPLGGIFSGLKASTGRYNFVVACDMPFINARVIKYMMQNIDDYDIIVPKIDGKFHPLLGIYSQSCIPVIQKMLSRNRLKISGIFTPLESPAIHSRVECKIPLVSKNKMGNPAVQGDKVTRGLKPRVNFLTEFTKLRVRFISKQELEKFDKDLFSLENINTKDDVERIKRLKGVMCQRCSLK